MRVRLKLRVVAVTILFLLSWINLRAQDVIYSTYERFDLRSGDFSIIGKVGDRLYTYRASSDGFFLDAWDDSMNRAATVMLDFFPRRIYETRFIGYSDRIIALYQSLDGTKVTQFAALLDSRGRLVKGPMTLSTSRTGILGADRDYYSYQVSDNKKWILIYGFNGRRSELGGTVIWLNDSLAVTDRGTAKFDGSSDVQIGEGMLDNDGTFFLPVYSGSGGNAYGDQAWMLSLARGSRKFIASEMPLGDTYVHGLFAKHDPANKRIYLTGFASDRKNGNAEQLIYARFDLNTNTWLNTSFLPIDEAMRNATGDKRRKQAFNDYVIRQLIIRRDGGFAILAEDYYVTTRNNTMGWGGYYSFYNGPFMSQNVREYHYEDVLAYSASEAGTRDWFSFVRKSQYSQEDGGVFSSYALLNTGGAFGLLFNDFNSNRARIGLATIDASGNVDMRYLNASGNDEPDWLPRSGKQVGAREIIVPCMRRRQLCFAKIVF